MKNDAKLIVYDWNGTLLDDAKIVAECFSFVIARWGLSPLSEKKFREIYDVPWQKVYYSVGITDEQIAQLNGYILGDDFLINYETRADHAKLHPEARTVLAATNANNVDQIILSNHIVGKIEDRLRQHDIRPYFNDILAYGGYLSADRAFSKEDKLRLYLKEKKIDPSNVVIIGDTPEETRIAHALGLTSVAVTMGYSSETRLRQENPHHIVHSMDDLSRVFLEMGIL